MSQVQVQRGRFTQPVDAAAVEASWQKRGYSLHRMTDPPGQTWSGFVHSTDELLTVESGELEATVDGQTLRVTAGDELFIPAHATHTVKNVHAGPTRWLFGYN